MRECLHVHTLLIDLRGIDPQKRYSDLWFRPFGEYRRVLDELIANEIGFVHGGGHPTGFIVAVKVAEVEIVTFHCLTEENDWEGETWYHYFLDEPGVLDVLQSIEMGDTDLNSLETIAMTWDEAERLTNQDHGEYMQAYWFGRLTNLEGLRGAPSDTLYKGKIRDYGEELFGYSEEETQP